MLTHWWITGGKSVDLALIRIYVDNEPTASIQFTPAMACASAYPNDGVEQAAPWATANFGKQAASGGWHSNFRVPFQRSINITYQAGVNQPNDVIYMIVRGAENLPLQIGGVNIPADSGARLVLQVVNTTLQPLEYVNVVDIPYGSGLIFQHTLSFSAGNLNTLEGCYHLYSPYSASFPGMLLSTGTEDYFVSD